MPTPTIARMWHPWRALRSLLTVDLVWTDRLPDGVLGATDGAKIWMTPRQLQAERRCTLTHELIHIERGHIGCQLPAIEAEVCEEAARRLIPLDDLVHAVIWGQSPDEVADELWVDLDTLMTRLNTLTDRERRALSKALAERDGW